MLLAHLIENSSPSRDPMPLNVLSAVVMWSVPLSRDGGSCPDRRAISLEGAPGLGVLLGRGIQGVDGRVDETGAQLVAGVARQPEALTRLYTPFVIPVSLVEATFFKNVAFMFVFVTPGA